MLPSVGTTKNTFTTAQAPSSTVGILAIAACSSTGTALEPVGLTRSDLGVDAFGYGPLTDMGAYNIATANKPTVFLKGEETYAGSYSGLDTSGVEGTSVVTTSGAPYDYYSVTVNIIDGGTIGVDGITFTWSVDDTNTSGTTALGTASTYTIPNTGVTFDFAAGTLDDGDTWSVFTQRPLMNDTGVLAALTALSTARIPYEGVLVDSSCTTSTVGLVDTFLSGLEAKGQFKFVLLNSRFKAEPQPSAETEAAYATALGTQFGNQTSIRTCVGADGAHVPSQITGYNLKRPTSMLVASRAMATPIGTDAAFVALGPLPGAAIADANALPFDHDEDLFPNLDGLRLMALRSFAPGGPQGVYVCNANTMQPSGGAFPYLQHIRIMNQACTIAWAVLTTQLSRGVRKNPKADPVTGAVYIFEPDASAIESLVNDALVQPMKGQVTAAQFSLSRTDNMSVVPCIVTGVLSVVALAYIKGYAVQAQFSKTLQTAI